MIRNIIVLSVIAVSLISISLPLFAQTKEVIVQGRAAISNNFTLAQAKNQAINMARSLAVEQAAGVSVNSATLLQNSLIVSELVSTFSYGFLIEEEILAWKGEWANVRDSSQLGVPVVEVSLRGVVSIPDKSFYRNHVLNANMNKKSYLSGERVSMTLSTTEDVFILVVNFTAENKIIPIYPNLVRGENLLTKDQTVHFPGKYSKEFEVTVTTLPGHNLDTEAFIIFGFPVGKDTSKLPWATIFPAGQEIEYSLFFKKILQLPINWLAQKTLLYTVVSN